MIEGFRNVVPFSAAHIAPPGWRFQMPHSVVFKFSVEEIKKKMSSLVLVLCFAFFLVKTISIIKRP